MTQINAFTPHRELYFTSLHQSSHSIQAKFNLMQVTRLTRTVQQKDAYPGKLSMSCQAVFSFCMPSKQDVHTGHTVDLAKIKIRRIGHNPRVPNAPSLAFFTYQFCRFCGLDFHSATCASLWKMHRLSLFIVAHLFRWPRQGLGEMLYHLLCALCPFWGNFDGAQLTGISYRCFSFVDRSLFHHHLNALRGALPARFVSRGRLRSLDVFQKHCAAYPRRVASILCSVSAA